MQKPFITHIDTHPKEEVYGLEGVWIQWLLSKEIGVPTFEMRYFTVEPGKATPYHKHEWEHEIFFVNGKGKLRTEFGDFELTPGTAAYVPPNILHQFENIGDEPMNFICVIPKRKD